MSSVVQLRQREKVSVDSIQISSLFRKLGPAQAEAVIIDGIEALSGQMRQMEPMCRAGQITAIPAIVQNCRTLSLDLGLVSLATVLGALGEACRNGDRTAATALWERVKRIGDSSFVDLWELPQLQM
jgi:hypothetical protein